MAGLILFCGLIVASQVAYGLIAYDCAGEKTNISVISMNDVAPCIPPGEEYFEEPISVRVLQRNEYKLQKVQACMVEITRMIYYCGMHSHVSIVDGALSTYLHVLGPKECQFAHKHQQIMLFNNVIDKLQRNGTTTASLTLHGFVDASGNCEGVSYSTNGITYKDAVVTATLKIQLRDYMTMVKWEVNEISLFGGITCTYLEGYCLDSILGESVWDVTPSQGCVRSLSILYEGSATLVKAVQLDENYLIIEDADKIFALSLIKMVALCNSQLWQTEHPRILVMKMESNKINPISDYMMLLPSNTDLMAYVNSKLLYVEQSYKRSIGKLYSDTLYRRCLLHRQVLRNRLLLAPLSPNAVSTVIKQKLGYVGRVLGEVLYVMQCTPKIAQIRRTENCYHELPVYVNNKSMFLAPLTHILQAHAEQVECNHITPPLYNIDGDWIGLAPHPITGTIPTLLPVLDEPRLEFKPIMPLGVSGIYTREEVDKVQRALTFGIERTAVSNIIARRISGLHTEGQGYTTLDMFSTEEMESLARSTLYRIWGWFVDVGMFFNGLMGIYFILRLLKYLLGVGLNGYQIIRTLGCGLSIIASLWSSLTYWLIHRQLHESLSKSRPKNSEEAEKAPEDTAEVSNINTTETTNQGTTIGGAETLYPQLSKWVKDLKQNESALVQ